MLENKCPNFQGISTSLFCAYDLESKPGTEAKPRGSTATGERKHRRGRAGDQPNDVHSHMSHTSLTVNLRNIDTNTWIVLELAYQSVYTSDILMYAYHI